MLTEKFDKYKSMINDLGFKMRVLDCHNTNFKVNLLCVL